MDEFQVIKKFFLPLAAQKENSLDLDDDAAIISIKKKSIVIATDSITEGDHFPRNEKNPTNIAKKLLRVNLSDIASMGAEPFAYTLNLSVPKKLKKKELIIWIKNFAKGLKQDQKKYNVALLGGDTVAIKGNLVMSLTAYGTVNKKVLKRSGARIGEDVYVTGNIGDSGIGYGILLKKFTMLNASLKNFYIKKHKLPDPPVHFAKNIVKYASAATDISDGFLADLNNLITSSKCGAEIMIEKIPFVPQTKKLIDQQKIKIDYLLSCGEDYQLIFTANKKFSKNIFKLAKQYLIKVVKVGKIIKKRKLRILDPQGKELFFSVLGFQHF